MIEVMNKKKNELILIPGLLMYNKDSLMQNNLFNKCKCKIMVLQLKTIVLKNKFSV